MNVTNTMKNYRHDDTPVIVESATDYCTLETYKRIRIWIGTTFAEVNALELKRAIENAMNN